MASKTKKQPTRSSREYLIRIMQHSLQKAMDTSNPDDASTVLIELREMKSCFQSASQALYCQLRDEEDQDELIIEDTELMDRVAAAITHLNKVKNSGASGSQAHNSSSSPLVHTGSYSLPKIKFPTFSGDSNQWVTFSTLFKDALQAYPQLTEGQKFMYLTNSLEGTAKKYYI